ncbi:hypothetical protein GCM10009733_018330 [Nonomuraea maheshkhaliensis]|uniref:Protein kinase domain-containing protein n=1 Tax=Nonomuraea maheshkhaliensis TaxID=419590 RepID=A0ABN2EY80_9ACTN
MNGKRIIGGVRLDRKLGEGGFGTVYLGVDLSGRKVAIKVLRAELAADPDHRERFLKEAEAARKVASFCTARVLNAGIDDGVPYIASEYIEGPTLAQAVREQGPRIGGALERLALNTVVALVAIHEAELIHRDLKPGNIILGQDGPCVIDFGIAKDSGSVTTTSAHWGSTAFMSPEQLDGRGLGTHSDMFSWALMMHFAATGDVAFPNSRQVPPAFTIAKYRQLPDLGMFTEPLHSLILACLNRTPEERPSAATVEQGLRRQAGAVLETRVVERGHKGAEVLETDLMLMKESWRGARPGESGQDFATPPDEGLPEPAQTVGPGSVVVFVVILMIIVAMAMLLGLRS